MKPARRARARRARGFLLIELLAALYLLAIMLAGLTPLLVTTIRGIDQANRTTAATTLARDKVEELRNTAYAAVASGSDVISDTTTKRNYNRRWTVSGGPTATTKAVTVTVTWADHRQHQISVPTMVVQ